MENLPFSKIDHVGIIVRDIDTAVRYYESLGMGPFEPLQGPPAYDRRVYGQPADDIVNKIMFNRMSPVRIELIQPVSGRSIQREFLEKRGEGLNHLSFKVDNLEKEVERLVRQGFKVISSGKFVSGGGFACIDSDRTGGVGFELFQE